MWNWVLRKRSDTAGCLKQRAWRCHAWSLVFVKVAWWSNYTVKALQCLMQHICPSGMIRLCHSWMNSLWVWEGEWRVGDDLSKWQGIIFPASAWMVSPPWNSQSVSLLEVKISKYHLNTGVIACEYFSIHAFVDYFQCMHCGIFI